MNINKKVLLGSTAAMVALSPLVVEQARAANISVPASATIVQAITLSVITPLDFGLLAQTGAGTININFTDTVTDDAPAVTAVGGAPTSAKVKIGATTGVNLVIDTTAATFKITTGGGGATKSMTISNVDFQLNGATGAPGASLVKTAAANPTFLFMGADLKVPAGRANGAYSGNVVVSVNYQ